MTLDTFLQHGTQYYLPNLSIDLVIIGYTEQELKCLLLKIGKKWVLPGGHIRRDEAVDAAVQRILQDRTGLSDPHIKFLSVMGAAERHFKAEMATYFSEAGIPWDESYWLNDRFVTLAHYSLVDIADTHPTTGAFDEAFAWFNLDELPPMWLDHAEIVRTARQRLKEDIKQEPVSHKLLPEAFTMPELHQLHQTILEEKLDRSRFQKKMLSLGIFERLPKRQQDMPGRNPYQYTARELADQ